MVNTHSGWFRLCPIAVLIGAFVVTARGGWNPSSADSGLSVRCELDPPHEISLLERCLALNPRDLEVMLDLGSLYEADRRPDRAEAIYRLALSIDQKDGDVHVRLGRVLLQRGDAEGAAAEARIALSLQPGTSRALSLLAHAGKAGDQ